MLSPSPANPFFLLTKDATDTPPHTKQQERQERLREMNAAERVALRTGRFFLANKYSRTFIFFYALALHLLVFLTLYKLAHSSAATTATPLPSMHP